MHPLGVLPAVAAEGEISGRGAEMRVKISGKAVDFLVSKGMKLCHMEVKSSGYRTHASLDAFRRKYSERISHSYLAYTKDLSREGDFTYLPAYMVGII